jgi:hypothetical protein
VHVTDPSRETICVGGYEVGPLLARGGMAVVHLAHQRALDRDVALKRVQIESDDPTLVERFLHEARVAAGLDHSNVVTLFDFFEHGGVPYIAMEYVGGGTLRPLIGALELSQVFGVLEGILAALAHAETHRIAHRDLKPENVLVTRRGGIKLADFGIARAYDAVTQRLTSTGTTVGTPAYVAPEQVLNRPLGPYTDLYAVGVMAYEMFSGRPPFDGGDSPVAVLYRHVNEPVPPLHGAVPDLPVPLCEWVEWLLAKAPADRPQSASEAWEALEEIAVAQLGAYWRRVAPLASVESPALARTKAPAALPDSRAQESKARSSGRAPRQTVPPRLPRIRIRPPGLRLGAALLAALAALLVMTVLSGAGGSPQAAPAEEVHVGGIPTDLAVETSGVWIAYQGGDRITVRDGSGTLHDVSGVGSGAGRVATGFGAIWVAGSRHGQLVDVDPVTREKRASVDVGGRAADVATGRGAVWVVRDDGWLVQVNPATLAVERRRRLGGHPTAVAVGPDALWVTDSARRRVLRVDPGTLSVRETIGGVGGNPQAIAALGDSVWVASADGVVSQIAGRRSHVVSRLTLEGQPRGIAAANGYVFVTQQSLDRVTWIDAARARVAGSKSTGAGPLGVAVGRDAVWVANSVDGSVTRVRLPDAGSGWNSPAPRRGRSSSGRDTDGSRDSGGGRRFDAGDGEGRNTQAGHQHSGGDQKGDSLHDGGGTTGDSTTGGGTTGGGGTTDDRDPPDIRERPVVGEPDTTESGIPCRKTPDGC